MNRPKLELYPIHSHQTSVPAFLLKLRNLLDDNGNEHLIAWDESGESFHLYDQVLFAKELLPKYFKHNNLASFVRQLNMYGFKKISTIDHGGLHSKEDMEFQNPYFVRDSPDLMESIKRKGSMRDKLVEYSALKPSQMSEVLVDMKGLRNSQNDINEQLDVIKRENSVLWREIASLRQKHVQQQHIINKLINFLMTMAGSRRNNMKRSLPMIEVGPSKQMRTDPVLFASNDSSQLQGISGMSSPLGVMIQDVTDYDTDNGIPLPVDIIPPFCDDIVNDNLPTTSNSAGTSSPLTQVQIQPSTSAPIASTSKLSPSKTQTNTTATTAISTTTPSMSRDVVMVPSSPSPEEFKLNFTDNIDGVQSDIDILRDLFSSDTLGFPQDTVYSLFDGSTDQIPTEPPKAEEDELFDLNDLIQNVNTEKKQQFINAVSNHSTDELNSLIKDVPEPDPGGMNGDCLEALFNESQQTTEHQPIVSSHELD